MNAVLFYRHIQGQHVILEYNFYDNKFAPSNLVVRKILMAMLDTFGERLNKLEVEYNDAMLIEKLGRKAGETLRILGATKVNTKENRSGDIVVSRSFTAPLTDERYAFFYQLLDLSSLPHYRLYQGEQVRIVFYFNQYLAIYLLPEEEELFFAKCQERSLPYTVN